VQSRQQADHTDTKLRMNTVEVFQYYDVPTFRFRLPLVLCERNRRRNSSRRRSAVVFVLRG